MLLLTVLAMVCGTPIAAAPPIDLLLASDPDVKVCNCPPPMGAGVSSWSVSVGNYKGWMGTPASWNHYGTKVYTNIHTPNVGWCSKNLKFYAHSIDNGVNGPHEYTTTFFEFESYRCPKLDPLEELP